jgi:hypothetical protein
MKRYEYKIYSKGGSYITTWKDVISTPNFEWNINGGLGGLTVVLKRPFSSFGEGNDVWFENMLRLEVYDKENPDGRLLYTGRVNEYKPYFGDEEKVEVSFVGYVTELDDRYLRDESSDDAINSRYLLPSGVLGTYKLYTRFNPDPNSPFIAMAQEFTNVHNTITGVGIQVSRNTTNVDPFAVMGIMNADLAVGTNQAGSAISYYRPGKILASGICATSLIPSGINTAIQQFTSVKFPNKIYVTPGKKYFAFITGSGLTLPMYDLSHPDWSGSLTSFGWTPDQNIAVNTPSFTNTNATNWLEGMGNITFFSNTSPRYESDDPTDIMQDIIQNKYSGKITWNNANRRTGYTVSYQFNKTRVLDAIKKCLDLTDPNWFWYIDANNKLTFKQRDYNVIDHTLRLGYEIKECAPTKSVNELKTRTLFNGGTPSGQVELYDEEDWFWQNDLYSLREQLMQDGRVTQLDTAKQLQRTYLDAHYRPITYMTVDVLDSNSDSNFGYDIESFVPGQFVRIIDPNADNYQTQDGIFESGFILDETQLDISDTHILSEPLQILRIQYKDKSATLSLGTILIDTPRRIEDIYREQQSENTKNAPLS